MKNKIKWILKGSRTVYFLYNRILSAILKTWGLFLRIDSKLILINSYGGAKYNDSPRAIYEYMKSNPKYNDYEIIWALDELPKNAPKDIKWVKNNSFIFFKTALKAKYWITNSSMERGLKFKKKNTVYINTWHGSVMKKMGYDTGKETKKLRVSKSDIFYCQGKHDAKIFAHAFRYPNSSMKIVGLPRNDRLTRVTSREIADIKKRLGIPLYKKVILYAPTFRDYVTDTRGNYLAPPINIKKWRNALSKKYVILFRAHYEISKVANIKYDKFIINMTEYEDINDLYIISDILISDYSSVMIDYSILNRPIFAYCYDIEEYSKKRGFCIDPYSLYPNGVPKTEDELLEKIININESDQKKRTKKFKEFFIEECGHATEYIDQLIK